MSELVEYRVLLALPQTQEILLAEEYGALCVPRVTIPKWTRPAETLIEAVQEKWQVSAVVVDFLSDDSHPACAVPACAVMEIRQKDWHPANGQLVPVKLDAAGACGLSQSTQAALQEILQGKCGARGPFSRLGWVDEAEDWIASAVTDREIRFTNLPLQLNACGTFALIRFTTKCGRAYWLKAVGEPNTHEFGVTTYLAEHCPAYLAELVCARSDWNAWVMRESGQALQRPLPLRAVEQVATRMAEIQTTFIEKTSDLFARGCVDQSVEVLGAHIDEIIAYLVEAMEHQTSTKVPRLPEPRLRELGEILRAACSAMHDLKIPNSLLHNDLNAGNVLFDGSQCVFIDWSEAYIGNPFLVFQQLYALMSRGEDTALPWVQHLRAAYKRQWRPYLTELQIDRAFALAPLLSVLSCLYERGSWLLSPQSEDAHSQGYKRSLARYMDRAARNPELLEAL